MAKKRVIAHFMHESEQAAAASTMTGAAMTEAFAIGEVDDQDIPSLRSQGLIIQELDEAPTAPETPGRVAATASPPPAAPPLLRQPAARRALRVPRVALPPAPPPADAAQPNYYLIELRGPLLEDWRAALQAAGVSLLDSVRRNHYTARMMPAQALQAQGLPFVASVRVYGLEDTISTFRPAAPAPPAAPPLLAAAAPVAAERMATYEVRLHRAEDRAGVVQWLQDNHVSIAGASARKIRLYLLASSPLLGALAALPAVAEVGEYVPPRLWNDAARRLLGVAANLAAPLPQTGAGQVVAVADTGLDESHPDFHGRVVGAVALGRPGDASDPDGHGTHVAGSVVGDGSASGGTLRGVAPGASLFFQSLLDAEGELSGLPLDLNDLFEEAYQAGARIHNNSWGAATASQYTINCIEVDEFVAKRRDMLIVIAAGNEGQAADRLNTPPGIVDWLSIGSPASCKNALTVGASRSDRTSGGLAALLYGDAWPADFPNPPIASDRVSGNATALAAFSSRGPCNDGRIKPDVVAPGTDIASTKSSRAPLRNFWGSYPGNSHYAYLGGTSMATPLVTGCAALVREYYEVTRQHQPSAALLKATLINGARRLTAQDAVASNAELPNFDQGFGAVQMDQTLPNPGFPSLRLEFVDTWQQPSGQFQRTGQRLRWQVPVAVGTCLRICLAFTDVPARGLQNDLNLFVQDPGGRKWIGNEARPRSLNIPDPDNNVEVVRIDNPVAGVYLIQITATNLLHPPQDFVLVVTGDVAGPMVAM